MKTIPLTEQDVVDRAEFRAEMRRWDLWTNLFFFALLLVALWLPVHRWLHAHLELLAGILIGSLLELTAVFCPRWLSPVLTGARWIKDRWLWMKWFSHQ
jgi:hypothetical protein